LLLALQSLLYPAHLEKDFVEEKNIPEVLDIISQQQELIKGQDHE